MLELKAVAKTVEGSTHIAPTTLTLRAGSLNVLLGPTLSGKTTLLRLMAGLEKPTQGRVFFEGIDVTGLPVQRRDVAMVYQQFVNYPSMTVFENIASPLRVAGAEKAEIDRRVRHAAELLQLTPYLARTPLTLSGGQQQRTALARAMVKGAKLVLLDEPLANLDYKLREELRAELPKVFAESGAILVYATTEPSEALLLGGNTATLHEGRVTQFGPTLEVFRRPTDLVTARTFADPPLNTIQATKAGGDFLLPGARIRAPRLPDGDYLLGVQAHHVVIGDEGASLPATVVITEITGSESYVHLDVAGSPWVALMSGVHDLQPDARVMLKLDPTKIMVFGPGGEAVAS